MWRRWLSCISFGTALALVLILAPACADQSGDSLFVDASGTSAGNGTPRNPFNTISGALKAARDRHLSGTAHGTMVIHVAAGAYTEPPLTIDFPDVQLIGAGPQATLIQADGSPSVNSSFVLVAARRVTMAQVMLSPAARGYPDSLGDPNAPAATVNNYQRSSPERGILIEGPDITIRDCIVEGFDFGIETEANTAAEAPQDVPGTTSLKVLNNVVKARAVAISILDGYGSRIAYNDVWHASGTSIGIRLGFNSDFNVVTHNAVYGPSRAQEVGVGSVGDTPLLPGTPGAQAVNDANASIHVVGRGGLDQGATETTGIPEGNEISSNTVEHPLDSLVGVGIQISFRSRDTVVSGNTVTRGNRGIAISGVANNPVPEPQGVDGRVFNTWVGTGVTLSSGAPTEGNTLIGPFRFNSLIRGFGTAIGMGPNVNTVVRGNTIDGFGIAGQGTTLIGIAMSSDSLETAEVSHNVVFNVDRALNLAPGAGAAFFGARIFLNDFTRYTTAVNVGAGYNLTSLLSADGKGNYWGLDCSSGGFDPTKVIKAPGVTVDVEDDHPYGVAVSELSDAELATTPTCQ